MNINQYWAKMDRVFDSKSLSSVQKSEELAKVLKIGYEQNLDILCVCNETEEGQAHQMYVNLDEGHPLSVGNRYMLCYTGHSRAIHDTHAPMYPKTALILEISTRYAEQPFQQARHAGAYEIVQATITEKMDEWAADMRQWNE